MLSPYLNEIEERGLREQRDGLGAERGGKRVPNSPTGQVLDAGPDFSVQIDFNDWT